MASNSNSGNPNLKVFKCPTCSKTFAQRGTQVNHSQACAIKVKATQELRDMRHNPIGMFILL